MSKASMETAIRNEILAKITALLSEDYGTDVLPVSASELALPTVDAEGNEAFALIKVSIPRGTRNGEGGYDPYDGYALAEDYKQELAEKEAKKAASTAKKEAERKAREERKAARLAKKAISEG